MPMIAKNDVGGTSTTNLAHWCQNLKDGRFASLEKKGQPSKEYPVENLTKNLNNKDIMLFVGSNDALAHKSDFKKLLDLLPK